MRMMIIMDIKVLLLFKSLIHELCEFMKRVSLHIPSFARCFCCFMINLLDRAFLHVLSSSQCVVSGIYFEESVSSALDTLFSNFVRVCVNLMTRARMELIKTDVAHAVGKIFLAYKYRLATLSRLTLVSVHSCQ